MLPGTIKRWFDIKNVVENIFMIEDSGEVMSFIVCGSKKCLIIDTGWGFGDFAGAVASITSLPATVVNTHGHPDHTGGNFQFPGIGIAYEDIELLESCNSLKDRRLQLHDLKNTLSADYSSGSWLNAPPPEIKTIKNGDLFDLGGRIVQTIAIPGHTAGCLGFIDRKSRILFSGDAIISGEIWLHLKESLPLSKYLDSLKFVDSISGNFDLICPAHGKILIEKDIVGQLIDGVSGILKGKSAGKHYNTFAGKGLRLAIGNSMLVYSNDRL